MIVLEAGLVNFISKFEEAVDNGMIIDTQNPPSFTGIMYEAHMVEGRAEASHENVGNITVKNPNFTEWVSIIQPLILAGYQVDYSKPIDIFSQYEVTLTKGEVVKPVIKSEVVEAPKAKRGRK